MAIDSKEFVRWVKDPLYAPVKRYLQERLKLITEQGDMVDRQLAELRYQGTNPEDFVIESVTTGKDGVKRISMIRRNRHFAHVDLVLKEVRLRDVLTELKVPVTPILSLADFISRFKNNEVQGKILYLAWRDSIGICLDDVDARTLAKTNELMGDIFFSKMSLVRESETFIDTDTLVSGTIGITDDAIGKEDVHLFVNELVSNELGTNRLEHNFPVMLTEQRGKEIRHQNKITLGGEDVTSKAIVTFSTASGRVICKTTPNNLESVFSVIKGSSTELLTDTITVNMSYSKAGKLIVGKTTIRFDIQKDTASPLTITSKPAKLSVPTANQVAVIVNCAVSGSSVKPTIVPDQLTSLVNNVVLTVQGEQEGGYLYTGRINTPVADHNVEDLLQGLFVYSLGTTSHRATCFIDLDISPAVSGSGKLIENKVDPSSITGLLGDTGFISLEITKNGDIVPVNELGLSINRPLGGKQLIKFTRVTGTRVYYELIKNSGIQGSPIDDVIQLDYRYVDTDGVVWTGRSSVQVMVRYPSDVKLEPISPEDVKAERYQTGPLPFKVFVNGVDQTFLFTVTDVTGTKNLVRANLDGYSRERAWMVLGKATADTVDAVTFTGEITLPDGVKTLTFTKNFQIKKYDGPSFVAVPSPIAVTGNVGDRAAFQFSLFNEDVRFNTSAVHSPAFSTATNLIQYNPHGDLTEQRVEVKYQFIKEGVGNEVIAYTKAGLTPSADNCALLTIPVTARPANGVIVNVPEAPTWRPFVKNELPIELTYNGNNVPLNDSRVTITVTFAGYSSSVISFVETKANAVVYRVNKDIGFVPETIPCTIIVSFIDSDGKTNTKIIDSTVTLVRDQITEVKLVPTTNHLLPIATQSAQFTLLADGVPVAGAEFNSLIMRYRDNALPPLSGYTKGMVILNNDTGTYKFSVSTTHLGGAFYPELKVYIGGKAFTVSNAADFIVDPQPITVSNVIPGNAIANVNTKVTFDLTQDVYGAAGTPVEMVSVAKLVGDPLYFKSVTNFQMVSPGKYSVDVVSTGKEGNGVVSFTITKNEMSEMVTKDWDVAVTIAMIKK